MRKSKAPKRARETKTRRFPLVSCLLPTHDRLEFALFAIHCFERQDYPNRELIIVDDGSEGLARLLPSDPGIRHVQLPPGVSLGTKRDYACHLAGGEFFAYWDDDDWSGPRRLSAQLAPLVAGEADLTALETETVLDLADGSWWRCSAETRQRLFVAGVNERTLAFHRRVWERRALHPNPSDDALFLEEALRAGARLKRLPGEGLYIYVRHNSNLRRILCGVTGGPDGWERIGAPELPPEDAMWFGRRVGTPGALPRSCQPLVTCIMPTAGRPALALHAIGQFLAQDYPNRELLVLDAGRTPIATVIPADPRIRYRRVEEPMSLGALRNLACREARGDLIAHWDDDDWMAPWRLRYQVEELLAHGADLCGLDRLYFLGSSGREAWEYVYPPQEPPWVAGGTMCYWKDVWRRTPFPDVSVGEDNIFVWGGAPKKILRLEDQRFYVATVHRRNTSPKLIHPERWHSHPPEQVRALIGPGWSEFARLLEEISPESGAPLTQPAPARRPLVSCVLATRDRPQFVRQAIRCFLRQTYRPAELLVADDGGQPVGELCDGLLNVRYVRCPRPMSLGAKLNYAIEQAQGDVIQKLDDDDHYGPLFLEQAVAMLDGATPDRSLVAWCCFLVLLPGEDYPRFSGHGWAAGSTLCFHRALWERTRFRDVPREVDRWFLEDAGAEVRRVCAPESLLVVRHGDHTWQRLPDTTLVEDYFRKLPRYHRPVWEVVEPIDRAFYESLIRNGRP